MSGNLWFAMGRRGRHLKSNSWCCRIFANHRLERASFGAQEYGALPDDLAGVLEIRATFAPPSHAPPSKPQRCPPKGPAFDIDVNIMIPGCLDMSFQIDGGEEDHSILINNFTISGLYESDTVDVLRYKIYEHIRLRANRFVQFGDQEDCRYPDKMIECGLDPVLLRLLYKNQRLGCTLSSSVLPGY